MLMTKKVTNRIIEKKPNYVPASVSNKDNMNSTVIRPDHFYCVNENMKVFTDSRMLGSYLNSSIIGKIYYADYIFNKI